MANNSEKTRQRDSERAAIVKKVAGICGVSRRFVYQVISGDRDSEEVMSTYMFLQEGENKLLDEVKKLIPFN